MSKQVAIEEPDLDISVSLVSPVFCAFQSHPVVQVCPCNHLTFSPWYSFPTRVLLSTEGENVCKSTVHRVVVCFPELGAVVEASLLRQAGSRRWYISTSQLEVFCPSSSPRVVVVGCSASSSRIHPVVVSTGQLTSWRLHQRFEWMQRLQGTQAACARPVPRTPAEGSARCSNNRNCQCKASHTNGRTGRAKRSLGSLTGTLQITSPLASMRLYDPPRPN